MALKNGNGLEGLLSGGIDVLLVVLVTANEGAEPATKCGEDLRVGIRKPLEDGGIVLLGLAKESGLLILSSN